MSATTDSLLSPNGETSMPTAQMINGNGSTKAKGIVVFSGGSAANNLVDVFKTVREDKKCPLSYVIPISDNGGSSSELIRVFGGPGMHNLKIRNNHKLTLAGIGDVRSKFPVLCISKGYPLIFLRSPRPPHPR